MRFNKILLLAAIALLSFSCAKKDYSVKGNAVTVKLRDSEISRLRPADSARNDSCQPSQIRLQVLGEKIIRVSATPERKFKDRKSLVVLPRKGKTPFHVSEDGGLVKVSTSALTASVDPATGKLTFTDAYGKVLLASG